jgi:hypothetical protein
MANPLLDLRRREKKEKKMTKIKLGNKDLGSGTCLFLTLLERQIKKINFVTKL